ERLLTCRQSETLAQHLALGCSQDRKDPQSDWPESCLQHLDSCDANHPVQPRASSRCLQETHQNSHLALGSYQSRNSRLHPPLSRSCLLVSLMQLMTNLES